MSEATRVACVMGWPAKHSRSPMLHGYWIRRYGIDGDYRVAEVPPEEFPAFLKNLLAISAPDARLLLFFRAFREAGVPTGDPAERKRITDEVVSALGSHFTLDRSELTYLDPHNGQQPETAMPGLVFWLTRKA